MPIHISTVMDIVHIHEWRKTNKKYKGKVGRIKFPLWEYGFLQD